MTDEWVNPYAVDPLLVPDAGGYNVFGVMDDGGVLCYSCIVDPTNPVHPDANDVTLDGWCVIAFDHTGNVEEELNCDHCNKWIVEPSDD